VHAGIAQGGHYYSFICDTDTPSPIPGGTDEKKWYVCIYVCVGLYIYMYVCMYAYIYVYTCMHIYVYIHVHIYIYTYS
jgi:hypothetical protein